MIDQTIKEVVIKVQLEQSQNGLDVAAVQQSLKEIQTSLQAALSRSSSSGRGSGSSGSTAEVGSQAWHDAVDKRIEQVEKECDRAWAKRKKQLDQEVQDEQRAAQLKGQAIVAVARGLATMAASADDESAAMVKSLSEVGDAFQILGAAAPLGPIGIAVAGLGIGLIALQKIMNSTKAMNRAYWAEMAQDAESASNRAFSKAFRQHEHAMQFASQRPDTLGSEQKIAEAKSQEAREQKNREIDNDPSLTPEQRAEQRRYAELTGRNDDALAAEQAKYQQLQERRQIIKKGAPSQEGRGHISGSEELNAQRNNLQSSRKNAETAAAKHGKAIVENAGSSSSSQALAQGESQIRVKEALLKTTEQIGQLDERSRAAKVEDLRLAQESVHSLTEQLKLVREKQQAAYQSVQTAKERVEQAELRVGLMNKGQKRRVLDIQAKHQRIRAKQDANKAAGRDVNEGVEKYTLHEAQIGLGANNIASQSIREQFKREGAESGIITDKDNRDELGKITDNAKKVDQETEGQANLINQKLAEHRDEIKTGANEIVEAMKASFVTQDLIADIKEALNQLQQTQQSRKVIQREGG
jgi:hypothetical protein